MTRHGFIVAHLFAWNRAFADRYTGGKKKLTGLPKFEARLKKGASSVKLPTKAPNEGNCENEKAVVVPDNTKPPFYSFTFWILRNNQPRMQFRLKAAEDEMFDLSIQQGPASKPTQQTKRQVPRTTAEQVRDTLQMIGALGWEESYGDESAPGSMRWSMTVVFQQDVFTLESKGGSDTPARFDELLEQLYTLDFPRPKGQGGVQRQGAGQGQGASGAPSQGVPFDIGSATSAALGATGMTSFGSLSAGDLGAYAATQGKQGNFSYLQRLLGASALQGLDSAGTSPLDAFSKLEGFEGLGDLDFGQIDPVEAQSFMLEFQRNPQAMQGRLKQEFKQLPPDQQEQMLDALTSLGFASRAWWEQFFRGF